MAARSVPACHTCEENDFIMKNFTCVKIPILHVIVFFTLDIYIRELWLLGGLESPILFLSFMSPLFNHSWVTAGSCLAHINTPSTRQDYIIYYLYSLYSLMGLGNLTTYQSWISWTISNHSYVLHPRLLRVRDWNIWSCHGWRHHLWLWYYWCSPLQYPRAPRVIPLWSSSCALLNMLLRCFL